MNLSETHSYLYEFVRGHVRGQTEISDLYAYMYVVYNGLNGYNGTIPTFCIASPKCGSVNRVKGGFQVQVGYVERSIKFSVDFRE